MHGAISEEGTAEWTEWLCQGGSQKTLLNALVGFSVLRGTIFGNDGDQGLTDLKLI